MMGTVLSKKQVHHDEASVSKVENTGKKHISNHVTKKQPFADSSSLEQYRVDIEKFAIPRYQVEYNIDNEQSPVTSKQTESAKNFAQND